MSKSLPRSILLHVRSRVASGCAFASVRVTTAPELADRPQGGRKDHAVTPDQVERIVSSVMSPPPARYGRWSTSRSRARVKLTSATVAKVSRANEVRDVVGLNLKLDYLA
jgi:hypothetical protein